MIQSEAREAKVTNRTKWLVASSLSSYFLDAKFINIPAAEQPFYRDQLKSGPYIA